MALLLTALAASLALVNCAPTSASQLNVIRARLPRRGYVSPATREHDRRKLQRRSTVPLTVNAPGGEDIEFLVDVLAGTPQQGPFDCIFDTGSDILYLPVQCTTEDCLGHAQYQTNASSTFSSLGQTVSIEYGKGSASGIAVEDVITIGNYTVQSQAFVAANVIDDGNEATFQQTVPIDPSACLVGISYATIPATGTLEQPGFMQNLYTSGQLSTTGAFGMYLVRAADVSGAASSGNATTNLISGSEICIDCVDTSKTDGRFATIPVSFPQTGFWAGFVDGVTINGQLQPNTQFNALFDSGTTLAGLPAAGLRPVVTALGATRSADVTRQAGGTGFALPCSNSLPATVGIQIAGVNFPFDPRDLVENFGQQCGLSLFEYADAQQGGPEGVLGSTFLKNVYSQFSYTNGGSIGIASLSPGASAGAKKAASSHLSLSPSLALSFAAISLLLLR